jgi:murein L,D-transpeptidase YcbB/YkuD
MKLRFPTAAGGVVSAVALMLAAGLSTPAISQSESGAAVVSDSLSPMAVALRAAFARTPEVESFYAARGYETVWSTPEGGLTLAGQALVAAFADAPRHALPADRYSGGVRAALPGADVLDREVAMTRAFLAYGRDINSGLLEPRQVDRDIAVKPVRPEPAALLAGIAAATDPAAYLASLAPGSEDYRLLLDHLDVMRTLAANGDAWGPKVPNGATLREGDRSQRIAAVRARLVAMGDLAPGASTTTEARAGGDIVLAANDVTTDAPRVAMAETADPMRFDATLAEAVRRFQARHGLNVDGVVGPATLAQINTSPAFRADQIAVNLERIRWLNRDLGRRHVKVNIPDFTMRVMENGKRVFDSRVVVGKYRHQTPEFSDVMDHMVVNPTWFVPRSIAVNEILPRLQEDPTYLDQKGYRLTGADAYDVDWTMVTPSTFPGSIRQRPGPGNALGRVKFMFPNDFAIYLHDTPQRHLFARDVRAYSHGCVRVEKPLEFAHFLLGYQESDPVGTFDRWLASGRERYVTLDEHLPVHITYRTAWVDEDGRDHFRGDIYGRDVTVMQALRSAGVSMIDG